MKKAVSIFFALAIILSGTNLTIATHYCGGKVAATKVSFSGKLASCGMEGTEGSCPSSESHLKGHCCDNKLVLIGMINNFTAPASLIKENTQNILQVFSVPVSQLIYSTDNLNHVFTDIGPPGGFPASAVSLNDICTFRI